MSGATYDFRTRTVLVTATRCYVGQATIEIPEFCRDGRILEIIRRGGATSRFLARAVPFMPLKGTGLQLAMVSPAETKSADIPLAEIGGAMRLDGFQF